ncbi:MAG: hypothetical protein ACP5L4_01410 [Thermoplasmata archaeon]
MVLVLMEDLEIKIRDIVQRHRKSKSPLNLPENFYSYAEENIKFLRDEMTRYVQEGKTEEYMEIKEKVERIEKQIKELKMIRLKMIFGMAMDYVFLKKNPDTTNLTSGEIETYENFKDVINAFIQNRKNGIAERNEKVEENETKIEEKKIYYNIVRILKDFPPDEKLRVYEGDIVIKKEDVLTVPSKLAEILKNNGYADIVDTIEVEETR